jgi:hypothetical protein
MRKMPGIDLQVPDEAALRAVQHMPKEQWFTIGDVPIQDSYKTLIYMLVKQPSYTEYLLVARDHYVRFMWQKNPSKTTACVCEEHSLWDIPCSRCFDPHKGNTYVVE